jgi:putative transposase
VRGAAHRIPDGCVARGWRFEVELTTPKQRSAVAQHFGARRFAYNWALAQVKGNLDARTTDATIPVLAWNLPAIRREWNQVKHQAAPWWRECSKEAYACGIADLVAALHNWSEAKHGRRGGRRIGFPRFKARRHSHGRVRFSTGAMRLEPDRRHIILPVIGRLRSKENTRPLERLLAKGRARILSMTLSEQRPGGRLFVSVATLVAHAPGIPDQPDARCGIDLGIGQEWAVIAHHDDTIERIAHPAPWSSVQQQRRRIARQRSRRIVGSRGHRQANAKLAALDRRAANLRREAIHTLTTRLTRRYGTIVVEDFADRLWLCPTCGQLVDRNANAARNLRDWTGPVTDRDVERGGVAAPVPFVGDHGGQAHAAAWACEAPEDHQEVAGACDTRTDPQIPGA